MITEVIKNVFKFSGLANVYYLKEHNILIDAGSVEDREVIKKNLSNLVDLNKIKIVIFTHLHYDHVANFSLFKNAKFYASKKEISNFKKDPLGTILNEYIAKEIKDIKLLELTKNELPESFKIINVPGHTSGSIAIYDPKNKLLFSGDTLFYNLVIGRSDLPTSSPKDIYESLEKLLKLDVAILCPGHNY